MTPLNATELQPLPYGPDSGTSEIIVKRMIAVIV